MTASRLSSEPQFYTGSWLESTQVHKNKNIKHHLVPSASVALEIAAQRVELLTISLQTQILCPLVEDVLRELGAFAAAPALQPILFPMLYYITCFFPFI